MVRFRSLYAPTRDLGDYVVESMTALQKKQQKERKKKEGTRRHEVLSSALERRYQLLHRGIGNSSPPPPCAPRVIIRRVYGGIHEDETYGMNETFDVGSKGFC